MADVHFLPVQVRRLDTKASLLYRFEQLLERMVTPEMVRDKDVAVKFHLGGRYGYTHVHPAFARRVVMRVKEAGGKPFITDHRTGNVNSGMTSEVLGCPIYHATGLKDRYVYKKRVGGKLKTVELAGYLVDADVLINLSHAKGHGQCGFGGAIKNLGMGAVTGQTRSDIHWLIDSDFKWHVDKCTHCRLCIRNCPHEALMFNKEGKLRQDSHNCNYCLHCVTLCPQAAIEFGDKGWRDFQVALAYAAKAVTDTFRKGRQLHINVALGITPLCDCWGFSTAPILADVGITASTDPVAVDKATIDLLDAKDVLPDTLPETIKIQPEGKHLLERIWGKDPYAQVEAAAKLKMGSMKYKLVRHA